MNSLEDISNLLEKYSKKVTDEVHKIVMKDAREARKDLVASSPKGGGRYARSWSVRDDSDGVAVNVTIYNKVPGLPHLLEFGHVLRNGTGRNLGSVSAREHIASVNDALQKKVVEDIVKKVGELK